MVTRRRLPEKIRNNARHEEKGTFSRRAFFLVFIRPLFSRGL
jgi:hypothetical protein